MVQVATEAVDRRRGIDHIGVTICSIIHDGHGKILLMKRGLNARDEHGNWDLCGGALEFGERVEDCIRREIKEELCSKPIEIEFLTAYDAHREYKGDPTHWIALLHAVRVDPKTVKLGEPDKFDDLGWFGANNLPEPLHSQLHRSIEAATKAGILY
jgi:8-oxo-dGTP diphosphatase